MRLHASIATSVVVGILASLFACFVGKASLGISLLIGLGYGVFVGAGVFGLSLLLSTESSPQVIALRQQLAEAKAEHATLLTEANKPTVQGTDPTIAAVGGDVSETGANNASAPTLSPGGAGRPG